MIAQIKSLLPQIRAWHGPLTSQLVQEPGRFGLGRLPKRLLPDSTTRSICGFCSTGCSLTLHLRGNEAVNLTPDFQYPVNLGMACPKGWEALAPLKAPDRATQPLRRRANGSFEPISWGTALEEFVRRMREVQKNHGAASTAFLSTGQIPCEEMALLGALAKFGMGMVHGDGNTRQCMATAATAYKESIGFDAPPFTYKDFELSDTIVLIGSNLCIAHPILWQRILQNKRSPAIVVIDPRKTETASAATHHLPIAPKSDLAFFYGVARELICRNWISSVFVEKHTRGFSEFSTFAAAFTRERVLRETGLSNDQFEEFINLLAPDRAVSFWWTMGVNQGHEATRTAQAIINLALMTGNIGKVGTGANSITGQCNAMGSRLFSNTTNLFGGRDFKNPTDRADVARILEIPENRIPTESSWAYDQIIDGIETGHIKALWIIATNPAHSWMNQNRFKQLREKLEFLVVQDMYHSTETALAAALVLPAAGWGEKEGTFINSERRFGVLRKASRAPGEALSDFSIFRLIANAWGCGALFEKWSTPEQVFQFIKKLSAGQPCDISGIKDYAMLDEAGGIQWPCAEGAASSQISNLKFQIEQERRLFSDGRFFHPDGKARFIFEAPTPVPEPVNAEYPLTLLTGRGSSSQWHTLTRTAKSGVLRKLSPQSCYVEIHPSDAAACGICGQETLTIESRRGRITARAWITTTVPPGSVFVPMHYPEINRLTLSAVDPYSRQPAYKACAVRVSPSLI
ncbi:MAG: molybdopterin oxidoreductase family protein [Methylacidiphilales bacterium]|nr:molybdopterin oxidoreductase family protein [Candidatus Methylacidiphilales bacterium]